VHDRDFSDSTHVLFIYEVSLGGKGTHLHCQVKDLTSCGQCFIFRWNCWEITFVAEMWEALANVGKQEVKTKSWW